MNALARRSNKGILQINKSDKESNKRKCTKGHTPIAVFFSVSIHFVPVLEPNIDMTMSDNFPTAVYLKFGIRMGCLLYEIPDLVN